MPTQFCNYTILSELGQGGMASVYRAKNQRGEPVALKVMAAELRTLPEARERFRREARMHPRHPNVVQILDSGECEGAPYIAMQLIEGESLEQVLRRMKTLAAEQFAPILLDICAALDAAHGQGIIHRDIKPSNILIRASDGRAFLTDFGVAKDVQSTRLTRTGHVGMGTAAFMSPEQARGQAATAASDGYALGVLAYEVLCGDMPFQAEDGYVLMRMHIQDVPPDLRSRNSRVPRAVSKTVMRSLEKNPAARYASAGAFAQAFVRALPANDGSSGEITPLIAIMGVIAVIVAALFVLGAAFSNEGNKFASTVTPITTPGNVIVASPSVLSFSTLTATSTLVPINLPTALPTITPTADLILNNSTPTPTASPRPAVVTALPPTSLPKVVLAAVQLLSPNPGEHFGGTDGPVFKWSWTGVLGADECFLVEVQHSQGWDPYCVTQTSVQARAYLVSLRITSWRVSVVKKANYSLIVAPVGELRPITWEIPPTSASCSQNCPGR